MRAAENNRQPASEAFCQEIKSWRRKLARTMAARNQQLTAHELTVAVQRITERMIFLRMAEDRGLEPCGQLGDLARRNSIYPALLDLYGRAALRYRSGFFCVGSEPGYSGIPDALAARLTVEDEVLAPMLARLSEPTRFFQLSVLRPELLGRIHEQCVEDIIHIGRGREVTIEQRTGLKKAGGVYYTPSHIIDQVVRQTIGRAMEGQTPEHAASIKILDPACGAGCFLLGAFRYLVEWYETQYLNTATKRDKLYQTLDGQWRLTIEERMKLVKNSIYGVDIDPHAVAITRVALLLEVFAAGPGLDTGPARAAHSHEPVFADLDDNIRCGNSLIASDFGARSGGKGVDQKPRDSPERLNVFDWDREYSAIPAFDVVLGNPPWGQKGLMESSEVRRYVRSHYLSTSGIYDLFRPFVEKAIRLTRADGYFGMVLPDIVLLKDYQETRRYLLDHLALTAIHWWGSAFPNATIDAVTIAGEKRKVGPGHRIHIAVHDPKNAVEHAIPQADFWNNPRYVFNIFLTPQRRSIVTRLGDNPKLGDYFESHEGVHSGNIRKQLFVAGKVDSSCKPLYFGRDEVSPYHLKWNGTYVRLSAVPGKKTRQRYANVGRPEWFSRTKLLVRRTGDRVLAALDESASYASNNFFVVIPTRQCSLDLDGLAAVLNSTFMTWYFRTVEPRKGRVFAELKIKHLRAFPLPRAATQRDGCAALNRLGKKRRESSAGVIECRTRQERAAYQVTCQSLDAAIDRLLCELYQLSDDDTLVIESDA